MAIHFHSSHQRFLVPFHKKRRHPSPPQKKKYGEMWLSTTFPVAMMVIVGDVTTYVLVSLLHAVLASPQVNGFWSALWVAERIRNHWLWKMTVSGDLASGPLILNGLLLISVSFSQKKKYRGKMRSQVSVSRFYILGTNQLFLLIFFFGSAFCHVQGICVA